MQLFKDLIFSWLSAFWSGNGFAKLFTTMIVGGTIILIAFILLFVFRRILISVIIGLQKKPLLNGTISLSTQSFLMEWPI